MVRNWRDSTFGKSTARLTMSPERNENTAMLKGVPLDCDDEYALCSIKNEYPCYTHKRRKCRKRRNLGWTNVTPPQTSQSRVDKRHTTH